MKRPIDTIKYLNAEETARLFKVIDSDRDAAIFRVAYHRGIRASEVALIRLQDYRPEASRMYVHRLKKGNSGEYVLTDAEVKALRRWLKVRGTQEGPLFPSNRGTGISRKMLDVLMKKYCRAAKIPSDKAHFHSLRHTAATSLLTAGRGIEEVQDHLGHRNIMNTSIYAKITNARRDKMAGELKGWK